MEHSSTRAPDGAKVPWPSRAGRGHLARLDVVVIDRLPLEDDEREMLLLDDLSYAQRLGRGISGDQEGVHIVMNHPRDWHRYLHDISNVQAAALSVHMLD